MNKHLTGRAHLIWLLMIKKYFFTSEKPNRYKLWSCQKICHALHYCLDNWLYSFCKNVFLCWWFQQQKSTFTAKSLKQGYRYNKLQKAFSKFYHRHSEFIVIYNFGVKTLLQQGISVPIFYGYLVNKSKRIVRKTHFSGQFKKIIKRYV